MASHRSSGIIDPGWEHGVAQDERKKKVRCNYCGKVVSGGIYRLKQHLARVSGEVTYCDKAPEDVFLRMRENLEGCRFSKRERKNEYDEQAYLNFPSNDDADEEDHAGYRNKGKQLIGDTGLVINLPPLRSLGYVDPGWEHGVPQDERKKKVKCNYCEKIVSGGINRFKQHLARIPGEVAPCKNAPEEVYFKIKENMKWHRSGRRHRRTDTKEVSAIYTHSDNEEEEDEQEVSAVHFMSNDIPLLGDTRLGRDSRRTLRGTSSVIDAEPLLKRPNLEAIVLKSPKSDTPLNFQQGKMGTCKRSRKEVNSAICKFFYHAGIPSQAANSPYFHKMLKLVGQYGEDFVGPSVNVISGRYLQDEILAIKNYLEECKVSCTVTGCSILADSWMDSCGRILINIMVSCPHGMYFVRSVDATEMFEDATTLFGLLDEVVEEMGEENVVQVITDDTPSFQAAGKMLEGKRTTLFWTPCLGYCIERMLEDFMKIRWVGECIEKSQTITKFIYNRMWLLNLMKKEYTGGKELLMPSVTRYASSFSTLQNILDQRIGLKRLFQSNKWLSSQYVEMEEGKEVERIVLNPTFWKKMLFVRKSVDPIMEVLQKITGDESRPMPFIYNDMSRAKFSIKSNHGDNVRKYGPFWTVIDKHWKSLYHHPLYLAAYFLNPSYRYRSDFVQNAEVVRGLNACIVRLEPDSGKRISASMQISEFGSAKADFGTDLAVSTRVGLNPAAWWQQHGINCVELQRIAVRILSQTCSSFGCDHNWSIYDQINRQRHNRVAQRRLNDFIYVHYNLRLRERQIRKTTNDMIPIDSVLQENLLYDWIVDTKRQVLDTERQVLQEDEEIPSNEMEQVDTYENEMMEYEDGNVETRKGCMQLVTLADVQPLDINPANNFSVATDDDDEDDDNDANINFLEDNMSNSEH